MFMYIDFLTFYGWQKSGIFFQYLSNYMTKKNEKIHTIFFRIFLLHGNAKIKLLCIDTILLYKLFISLYKILIYI